MSETIPLSSIETSSNFWESVDPLRRLAKTTQMAFQSGTLELWFMGTHPPTPEECRAGYQILRNGTDDMPPSEGVSWREYKSGVDHGFPVQMIHNLDPAQWIGLDAAMGQPPGNHLLSLVPASAHSGFSISLTAGPSNLSNYYRGSIRRDDNKPMLIRWALLRSRGGQSPRELTWATTVNRNTGYTNEAAPDPEGPLIFDFRDGIPLTVGPRESNANLRIGAVQRFSPRVELFSLHVPLPIINA